MEVFHGSATGPLDKHWWGRVEVVHPDYGWDSLFSLQCQNGHGALLLPSTCRVPPAHMSCEATATPTWGPPVPPGSHKQDPLLKDPQLLLSSYQTLSNPWYEVAQVIRGTSIAPLSPDSPDLQAESSYWKFPSGIDSLISSMGLSEWVKLLSRVWLFVTPWTVAYNAPSSMGFSRQEYWSWLPFPSPGDLPNPGIELGSPTL